MDQRWRDVRIEAAHEAMARRHPIATLYGRQIMIVVVFVSGLGVLAHWIGFL